MLKELLDLFERFVVSQESIAESTRKMADVACVPPGANICAGPLTAAPVADPVDQGGPVDYNLMSLDALKALCESRGITAVLGPDGKTKPRTKTATLVKALETADAVGDGQPLPSVDPEPGDLEPTDTDDGLPGDPEPTVEDPLADDPLLDEPEPQATKLDVQQALTELSKRKDMNVVRDIMAAHGGGAKNISALDPKFYNAVIRAANEVK